MSQTITYPHCPVCKSNNISFVLSARDHTVSKELFEVWECASCTLRFTQNVPDSASIGVYYQSQDYVSHSNTKKGLVNRLYHWVRAYTLGAKRRLIHRLTLLNTGSLLDVGAGTGAFLATMKKAGWSVDGLEPDDTARQNALRDFNVTLQPAEKIYHLTPQSYDAITMWHVLEHVHDLHGYMEVFRSLLKPQGTLIIAVPNYTSYDADLYGEHWAAYDVPRHLYHFSPQSMDVLAEQHGLQVVAHRPMWFDSFYVSMLSEKYRNNYNNYFKAAWNGWLSNWEAFSDPAKCSSVIYVLRIA